MAGKIVKDGKVPESCAYCLSIELSDQIVKNNPKAKHVNIEKWSKTMDLMLWKDNRHPNEIRQIIKWSQNDGFWRRNILSPKQLRAHYNLLVILRKDETLKRR